MKACGVQTSLSLGAGFPTSSSVPHSLMNGFKNLVCAVSESGYEFNEAIALLETIKNAQDAEVKVEIPEEAAEQIQEEKKVEEQVAVDFFDIFGDDEY